VQRGAALVQQILTFARKTDILFESMNLLELVHELLSMLNQTFPKTIILRENIEKDIPYISADRTQIYQALLNLYVNARDAMPNGGCITLTIEKRTGEQIREQFHNVNQDSYLCVSVTDTGEGMDETTRSRIFDPFFTTKEKWTLSRIRCCTDSSRFYRCGERAWKRNDLPVVSASIANRRTN
jgi:signal transduction histidine kinase